jgi:hypothetical protein
LDVATVRIQPGSASSGRKALEPNSSGKTGRLAEMLVDSWSRVITATTVEQAVNLIEKRMPTRVIPTARARPVSTRAPKRTPRRSTRPTWTSMRTISAALSPGKLLPPALAFAAPLRSPLHRRRPVRLRPRSSSCSRLQSYRACIAGVRFRVDGVYVYSTRSGISSEE